MLLWLVGGWVSPYFGAILVLITFIHSIRYAKFNECFIMYLFILIFSDSRSNLFLFAELIKPILALLLSVLGFKLIQIRGKRKSMMTMLYPFALILIFSLFLGKLNFDTIMKSVSYVFLIIAIPFFYYEVLSSEKGNFFQLYFQLIFLLLCFGFLILQISPSFVQLAGRYRGMLGNPNGLGLFVMLNYFLFQFVKWKFPNLFGKRFIFILMLLFWLSVLYSQSRNALMVMIIFHIYYGLNRRSPILSFTTIFVFLMSYNFIFDLFIQLIVNLDLAEFARLDTLEEGSGRLVAWNFIWNKIMDSNYLFGHGMGATQDLFFDNFKELSLLGHQGNAHNSYLTFWYDFGLIGLLAFLIGTLSCLFSSKKNPMILPIFSGIFISAFFESWMTASLNPFTIIFVILLVLFKIDDGKQYEDASTFSLQ